MKLACSSATFAEAIRRGDLTQLDWLDVCANELEMDGVVFGAAHFARTDAEYLAQMKKAAVDLGLTAAAVALDDAFAPESDAAGWLERAVALGAPLLIVRAPLADDDAGAWGAFADALKTLSGAAKRTNVTLALANAPGTLCANALDLRRAAKDVDSAWVRFALDVTSLSDVDPTGGVLAKSTIATYTIDAPERFATAGDPAAADVIARLARFRGFICLDLAIPDVANGAYHAAVARFAAQRRERARIERVRLENVQRPHLPSASQVRDLPRQVGAARAPGRIGQADSLS